MNNCTVTSGVPTTITLEDVQEAIAALKKSLPDVRPSHCVPRGIVIRTTDPRHGGEVFFLSPADYELWSQNNP